MIVTAWNNGQHRSSGTGYGIKINANDRDRYFDKNRSSVFIRINNSNNEVEINIEKDSFWSETCRELICKEIGIWLRNNNLAPWPKMQPPRFVLKKIEGNHFHLCQK